MAEAYGKRKGISYGTWRAAGVSANVLQAAGITRGEGLEPPRPSGGADAIAAASSERSRTSPSSEPNRAYDGPLGMGHQPDDVARLVGDAGDVVDRAVGVVQVPQHHAILVVQPSSVSSSQT